MSPGPLTERVAADGQGRHEALDRIFADLEDEHRAFIELVASLPEADALDRPGGEWSAVDSLVHITSWKENALRVARQQAEPDAPDPDPTRGPGGVLHINVDRFNAEVLAARRDWSAQQALAWANDVHRDLIEALRRLPEERVLGGRGRHGARMWYWMPGFIHSLGLRRALNEGMSTKPEPQPDGDRGLRSSPRRSSPAGQEGGRQQR